MIYCRRLLKRKKKALDPAVQSEIYRAKKFSRKFILGKKFFCFSGEMSIMLGYVLEL